MPTTLGDGDRVPTTAGDTSTGRARPSSRSTRRRVLRGIGAACGLGATASLGGLGGGRGDGDAGGTATADDGGTGATDGGQSSSAGADATGSDRASSDVPSSASPAASWDSWPRSVLRRVDPTLGLGVGGVLVGGVLVGAYALARWLGGRGAEEGPADGAAGASGRKHANDDAERAHRAAQRRDPPVEPGDELSLVLTEVQTDGRRRQAVARHRKFIVFVDQDLPGGLSKGDEIRAKVTHYGGGSGDRPTAAHAMFLEYDG